MNERTPAGGDTSAVTFFDINGTILPDAIGAVTAEISEYADDILIRSTHTELRDPTAIPAWTDPGQVGTEPEVISHGKLVWDVYLSDHGQFRLVTTLPDLFAALNLNRQPTGAQKASLLNLMGLPSWQGAPADLHADAAHWLATH